MSAILATVSALMFSCAILDMLKLCLPMLQVAQLPPEKKPRLEEDATTTTSSSSLVDKDVGGSNAVEEDDVIPKIKSSHLDLDDIPVELLPTHQEKIMKQV